jgi:hypothetical protein
MLKGVAGAYDAAINSLKKQSSLDYRLYVLNTKRGKEKGKERIKRNKFILNKLTNTKM